MGEKAEEELEKIHSQYDEAKTINQALEEKIEFMNGENDKTWEELIETQEHVSEKDECILEKIEECNNLKSEFDALAFTKEQLETKIEEVQKKNENLRQQVDSSQKDK